MVFRRRMSRLQPINRTKHVVDFQGGLTSVAGVAPVATVVDTPTDPFKPGDIVLGSTVNAFFISYFIIGDTGAPLSGPLDWYLAIARAGQDPNTDFPDPGLTGVSNVRNQIIHEEKGLSGSGDGTPMVFKGVIVVPKIYRRSRSGDQWFIKSKSNSTDTPTFCQKIIFNEFK